jgi:DNA-binding response OmpR family regulator
VSKSKILIVEDEEFNLDILKKHLKKEGYHCLCAKNGKEALIQCSNNPNIDLIVLDRMMPEMDGMEFLHRVKSDAELKSIPVIMQTAAAEKHQVLEGIKAGVYYYLRKPYAKDMLLAIIKAALRDQEIVRSLGGARRMEISPISRGVQHMEHCSFSFKSISEARMVAVATSTFFPEPAKVVLGLTELMINAVEHGNLGLTFEEKAELVLSNALEEEIQRRMGLPENAEKSVCVEVVHKKTEIEVTIADQGNGFEWKNSCT